MAGADNQILAIPHVHVNRVIETVRLQRENLLRDLLPIVDNLERAVAAARGGGNGKPIVEGVEMVLRSMLDFLRGHGVTQLSVVGEPFDPQRHEAIAQVESSQHPPNTVLEEHHRGYLIGDRMLRPARVSVAKPGNGGFLYSVSRFDWYKKGRSGQIHHSQRHKRKSLLKKATSLLDS